MSNKPAQSFSPDLPMTIRKEHLMCSPHSRAVIKPEHQGKYPKEFLKLTPDTISWAYPTYIEHWDGRRILLPENSRHTIIPRASAFIQRVFGQKIRHKETFPFLIAEMSSRK